jgi:hypothetical protein
MKAYYQIEYWNKLFNMWTFHDSTEYSSLQEAKNEIKSYKEHELGVKFRIIKTEIVYTDQ